MRPIPTIPITMAQPVFFSPKIVPSNIKKQLSNRLRFLRQTKHFASFSFSSPSRQDTTLVASGFMTCVFILPAALAIMVFTISSLNWNCSRTEKKKEEWFRVVLVFVPFFSFHCRDIRTIQIMWVLLVVFWHPSSDLQNFPMLSLSVQ